MGQLPQTRISLILRLADPRDVAAWDEFVAVYGPAIFRLVVARGLQAADAEDVAQEVLFAVARAVERFQHDPQRASFRTWLSRIARNIVADHFQRSRRTLPTQPGDVSSLEPFAPEADWDEHQWREELRTAVFEKGANLIKHRVAPATWQAFQLTAIEQRTVAEAAQLLNSSVGSVYVNRCRVIKAIRREVERLLGDDVDCLGGTDLQARSITAVPSTKGK